MKKLFLTTLVALLPAVAFADVEYQIIKPKFFIEYNATILSSVGTKTKANDTVISDVDTLNFNTGNGIFIGGDFNGIQLGVSPSYSEQEETSAFDLMLKLDVPFMEGNFQPYVSLSTGFGVLSIDNSNIDNELGFAYGIGGGVKYSFNENTYMKFGLEYAGMNFSTSVENIDVELKSSGFGVTAGFGYVF